MKEEFLQFVWRFQLFNIGDIKTSRGKRVDIIQPGYPNELNAGPDFSDALIRIGEIEWCGHIEVHLKASEWYQHKHDKDSAYNNVVLHVVLDDNCDVMTENNVKVPTINLRKFIYPHVKETYRFLIAQSNSIPCHFHFSKVLKKPINHWFDRIAFQRLERKSGEIIKTLVENKGDWEQTYIMTLCKYLGYKVNATAFSMLSRKLDWKFLQRNAHNISVIEAYIYGLAGFLEEYEPIEYAYINTLKKIFGRLKRSYGLTSLPKQIWKFSRMRPDNFPTLRIAELCAMVHKHKRLWADIKSRKGMTDIMDHFNVEYSLYWQGHYMFAKESKKLRKGPGRQSQHLLLINVVSPLFYGYGKAIGDIELQERAMDILQQLPSEKNRIVRKWEKEGCKPETAWDSQGLIELKQQYCSKKRCMECHIGKSILLEMHARYEKKTPIIYEKMLQ